MLYSVEDDVFRLLPDTIMRPGLVTVDGGNGVTLATFSSYQVKYAAYIDSEILKASLVLPTEPHPLLREAEANMVAGMILRRFQSLQQMSKDCYATGNMFLRQYIQLKLAEQGRYVMPEAGVVTGPKFITDTSAVRVTPGEGFPDL